MPNHGFRALRGWSEGVKIYGNSLENHAFPGHPSKTLQKDNENEAFWGPEIHRKIIGSVKNFQKSLQNFFTDKPQIRTLKYF